MQYNVAQLLKESIGATRRYRLGSDGAVLGSVGAETVDGTVQLLRTHQGILARGEAAVTARQTCGRCLGEFTGSAGLQVEEEFFPQVDVHSGRRLAWPDDAEGMAIDANHILDLTETVRQSVVAAQPMKPLCREDCAGLCPECGVNRNDEICTCGDGVRDPRWGALTALLRETEG